MNERQKAILRILSEDRELTVTDLADRFKVSGVTIRQDLDALQKEGLLKRVHGGAVLHSDEDIGHRLGINFEEKLAIATVASARINKGDTIFIEAGSANAVLARELSRRSGIRVVTNNVFIARTLKDSDNDVIILGGYYQHESECVVGQVAKVGLQELNFTKAFIGLDGFTFDDGLTCSDMMRAEITTQVVGKAQEVYVLTDFTKFGRVALSRICTVEEITEMITDEDIPPEYVDGFSGRGISLVMAKPGRHH